MFVLDSHCDTPSQILRHRDMGKDNEYGYPKQVVLDKLSELNTKVYRTDQLGTIILTSNGKDIEIENKYTDTNNE